MTKSSSYVGGFENNNYSTIGKGRSLIKSSSTVYPQNNDASILNKYKIENKSNIGMNNYRINREEKIPEAL